MLKKVMLVVLFGCLGLTAGVACGTLFSGNNVSRTFTPLRSWDTPQTSAATPAKHTVAPFYLQGNCHRLRNTSTRVLLPTNTVQHLQPGSLGGTAPPGPLPMGAYVLFGLLGGLSAALGFLVPPGSNLTSVR